MLRDVPELAINKVPKQNSQPVIVKDDLLKDALITFPISSTKDWLSLNPFKHTYDREGRKNVFREVVTIK